MTCIVAVREGDRVVMGGDSRVSMGWNNVDVLSEPKVFKRAGYLIGVCGTMRFLQEVRHSMTFPRFTNGGDPLAFMATKFVRRLKDTMQKAGYQKKKEEVEMVGDSVGLLVAVRGRIFRLSDDYSVVELSGPYAADGSGADVALGALFATEGQPARDRVQLALEAAARHTAFVGPPFHIVEA